MNITYKERCRVCKKNMVLITSRGQYPICYECHKKQMDGPIEDKEMKKLFDIPEDFYKNNTFLRSIKKNYLRFGNLTEKQLAAFKRVVEELNNPKNKEKSSEEQ